MNDTTTPTFIAFASPKGGSGKSTSCVSIAGALLAKGHSVHIVDFDQSQTLWRWFTDNAAVRSIPGLSVEKGSNEDTDVLKRLWKHPAEYVLIDLAGQLTRAMLHIAVFATVTITPVKLSEPDIVEANKLHEQLRDIQKKLTNKTIIHRLLVNDVQPLMGGFEYALLDELNSGEVTRFQTLVRHRVPYGESFITGEPPHFADQKRGTVAKARDELDDLLAEIDAVVSDQQETNQQQKDAA